MKNKPVFLLSFILASGICILPFFGYAQADPGCGPDCPIDGGLIFLLAAGAGYAVKHTRKK